MADVELLKESVGGCPHREGELTQWQRCGRTIGDSLPPAQLCVCLHPHRVPWPLPYQVISPATMDPEVPFQPPGGGPASAGRPPRDWRASCAQTRPPSRLVCEVADILLA